MHTLSMRRTSSSRATIAAGTSPPRVMQTIAWNGPAAASRQAKARASRWNWSQETGKALGEEGDIGLLAGWGLDLRLRRLKAGDESAHGLDGGRKGGRVF